MAAKGPLPRESGAPSPAGDAKGTWHCDEHPEATCGCGIGPGQLQLRNGLLCAGDARGRLYVRAPRRADVALAQRVAATLAVHPLGPTLAPNVTHVYPEDEA